MNTLLVKFHTLFLPELSEGPLMADGRHVLEEVASRRHVMLGPVLRVWTHAGLSGQHNAHVMWSSVMTLDSKDLRMTGCVNIAHSDEHTAEDSMVKFHTLFLPELSENPLGVGRSCQPPCQQHQENDRWPSSPRRVGQSSS